MAGASCHQDLAATEVEVEAEAEGMRWMGKDER
jgi:hypothetical protein